MNQTVTFKFIQYYPAPRISYKINKSHDPKAPLLNFSDLMLCKAASPGLQTRGDYMVYNDSQLT